MMGVKRLRHAGGATLVEQLAALLIGSALITSLYGYFRSELYHLLELETRTSALEDARGALDIMIRDLKNAGSWGSGSVPAETGSGDDPDNDADVVCNRIYAASATLIHVQMDLDGDGNCTDTDPRENIRLELTGPTATCPGPHIIRRNGDCLIASVVPSAFGKVFSYFDTSGNDLGSAPPFGSIKRVRIAFGIQVKHSDPKIAGTLVFALSSSVELRN